MKVTIERAALLKAMSRAQGVVERKNTIPILANVLLGCRRQARLSLRATDLDIEVHRRTARDGRAGGRHNGLGRAFACTRSSGNCPMARN